MNYLKDMNNIPIEIIFKYILFINIFEIEKNKKEEKRKIYKFLSNNAENNKNE